MLEDRRVLIVGATGGIGSALVEHLVAAGARIVASGRDATRLERLRRLGAVAVQVDLAEENAPAQLAAAAQETFGDTLDGLVLAAAQLEPIAPTRSVDVVALEAAFRVNTLSALATIQACAPLLDRSGAPSLIALSGGGATSALPRFTAYALSKIALVRLVENLAAEEPRWKVNAVAPGFVATGIHDATLTAGPDLAGDFYEETLRRIPDAVPPHAASELVAFLLSDESGGITGRLLSAIWDDWRDPDFQARLRTEADFARLRRIDGERLVEVDADDP